MYFILCLAWNPATFENTVFTFTKWILAHEHKNGLMHICTYCVFSISVSLFIWSIFTSTHLHLVHRLNMQISNCAVLQLPRPLGISSRANSLNHDSALHTTVVRAWVVGTLTPEIKLWLAVQPPGPSLTGKMKWNSSIWNPKCSLPFGEVWTQSVLPSLCCWSIPIVLHVDLSQTNVHCQHLHTDGLVWEYWHCCPFFKIRKKHIDSKKIYLKLIIMYINGKLGEIGLLFKKKNKANWKSAGSHEID